MSKRFHLVLETPHGNLAAEMRWLLSSYTLRLNHRRKLSGHVFGGRYKAVLVDGNEDGSSGAEKFKPMSKRKMTPGINVSLL